jgi:hypothetical protein
MITKGEIMDAILTTPQMVVEDPRLSPAKV